MTLQSNHISVTHGSLTVNVPRNIFKPNTGFFIEEKEKEFRELIGNRYPWLTSGSLDILMKNASREMIRVIDEESKGKIHSKNLASAGKLEEAIQHMQRHLEEDPNDADSWYALGELLCKVGRTEEGYRAMNRGRDLF